MRKMKDSGVEWIGEIPVDWKLSKIGSVYDERNEKVSDKDFAPLSVTKQGIVPQLETAAKTDNGDNRKLIRKDDFVINSRSDRRGSCGISEYEGSCSLINTVLKPQTNMCNRYYGFVFKSDGFADEYYRWGHGIVDDLWSTKWIDMKSIYIPAPDITEQERIADYLDAKCSKIDEIIEKQQAIIEKLKEYKLSIITEGVTKGLKHNVKMKDSGVRFVDTIPYDWENRKMITILSTRVVDGPHESPELYDTGIPYISATAIVNGKIDFSLMRGYISKEYCEICDKRYSPQRGDLLVVKLGASTGQVAIVDTDERFNIWVPLAAVRCNDEALPKFVYYVFQSDYFVRQMELSWTFGTQQTLGVQTIEKLRILLPPIAEQREIVKFLDTIYDNVGSKIENVEKMIEKLEEYKKSLIYEVVTGKKEV
jgi:type I restriction enzyme S subunit